MFACVATRHSPAAIQVPDLPERIVRRPTPPAPKMTTFASRIEILFVHQPFHRMFVSQQPPYHACGTTLIGDVSASHISKSSPRRRPHRRMPQLGSPTSSSMPSSAAPPHRRRAEQVPITTPGRIRSYAAPHTSVAITGVPAAIASGITIPCGSYTDGSTNASACAHEQTNYPRGC